MTQNQRSCRPNEPGTASEPTAQLEVERKYLLSALPDLQNLSPDHSMRCYRITQGYLNADRASEDLAPLFADMLACPLSDDDAVTAEGLTSGDVPVAGRWIRIRRIEEESQPRRHIITFKTGTGMVRVEREQNITSEAFEALWPETIGKRLLKRRWRVESDADRAADTKWVIDNFLDRPLVLLEVELIDGGQRFAFPQWLAPLVERDVTDDWSYANLSLAR